ncbi:MAG TPA: hypothetical protein VNT76_01090 [Candidatus Binatus sp.]|nr:hypothetical protein [Candidatus Binatus sp.]
MSGTSGELFTAVWPCLTKKFKNDLRISVPVIISLTVVVDGAAQEREDDLTAVAAPLQEGERSAQRFRLFKVSAAEALFQNFAGAGELVLLVEGRFDYLTDYRLDNSFGSQFLFNSSRAPPLILRP